MNKQYKESLATYLEPKQLAANTTRTRLGLAPIDITDRDEIMHEITYFEHGYRDGKVGYYDTWYDDKKAWSAYLEGYNAGKKLHNGDIQVIG